MLRRILQLINFQITFLKLSVNFLSYIYGAENESANIRENFPQFEEEAMAFYAYYGADANQGVVFIVSKRVLVHIFPLLYKTKSS